MPSLIRGRQRRVRYKTTNKPNKAQKQGMVASVIGTPGAT